MTYMTNNEARVYENLMARIKVPKEAMFGELAIDPKVPNIEDLFIRRPKAHIDIRDWLMEKLASNDQAFLGILYDQYHRDEKRNNIPPYPPELFLSALSNIVEASEGWTVGDHSCPTDFIEPPRAKPIYRDASHYLGGDIYVDYITFLCPITGFYRLALANRYAQYVTFAHWVDVSAKVLLPRHTSEGLDQHEYRGGDQWALSQIGKSMLEHLSGGNFISRDDEGPLQDVIESAVDVDHLFGAGAYFRIVMAARARHAISVRSRKVRARARSRSPMRLEVVNGGVEI